MKYSSQDEKMFSRQIKEMDYVKGGLGWKVWGTALLLSSRIVEVKESFIDSRVLELGSGCGLCGLLAVKLGASEVVLSDCVPDILENLCENILLLPAKLFRSHDDKSREEESSTASTTALHDYIYEGEEQPCVVQVRMLDWFQDGFQEMEGVRI
jgi:predicted nicotinamide N-methyase